MRPDMGERQAFRGLKLKVHDLFIGFYNQRQAVHRAECRSQAARHCGNAVRGRSLGSFYWMALHYF